MVNLRDGLHYETSVIVVDKISYSIHGVEPRTVGVLILQNEIHISLCNPPVLFIAKNLRRTREEEGAIRCSIDYPADVKRRVGRTAGTFRRSEILNISSGMS